MSARAIDAVASLTAPRTGTTLWGARYSAMAWKPSVGVLTLCHAAMGAVLGALSYAALVFMAVPGFSDGGRGGSLVILAALSSWMAVGAGLTGFVLTNVDRAGDAG